METAEKREQQGQPLLPAQAVLCPQAGKAREGEADPPHLETQERALETKLMD